MAKKTKQTITASGVKSVAKRKGIQAAQSACIHCGLNLPKVGQHTPRCLMNPNRQYRNGYKSCGNCKMEISGPNFDRHVENCNGSAVDVVERALQSFRSEYIKTMHNGVAAGRLDRSLGSGNRSVPEVVRNNVIAELIARGMPDDWVITSNLRLSLPVDEETVILDSAIDEVSIFVSDRYNDAVQFLRQHVATFDDLSKVIKDIIGDA